MTIVYNQKESKIKAPNFVLAGGEMGKLTREYDWSQTSIGNPEQWPQSLQSTISILLNSKFPMFLWWGEDLIQFYNDAYRPSLGNNGKHPKALGQKGIDCWPEIWPVIKPLIDQVRSGGGATWSEDQLIPIYRNGKLEDVYWTFGYSPVIDESGEVGGVLVVCNETTDKINSYNKLEESKAQLSFALDAAELATWDFDPIANKFAADARYADWFGIHAEEEYIDNNLALQVIAEEDRERVIKTYTKALDYSSGIKYDIEYKIRPQNRPERILRAKGKVWFNNEKIAYRFTGTLQDVTESVIAHKFLEDSEKNLRGIILQAPVAMCILKGHNHTVEIANDRMCGLWGMGLEVMGRPIFEFLPEAKEEGFETLLNNVYNTGQTYKAYGVPVTLPRKSGLETVYIDFLYEAFREADGSISGVMAVAIDVTEQMNSLRKIKKSEQQVRSLIESAPFPIGVYVGKEMQIQFTNQSILDVWGKGNDVIGKLYYEVLPELDNQKIFEQLDRVYTTGIPFHAKNQRVDLMVNGQLHPYYFNYSFTPLYDASGKVYGVMNTAADVTDLNFAKKKLEEEKERTKLAIDAGELGIFEIDLKTNTLISDKRFNEIMGFEKTPLNRNEIRDIIHPDDLSSRYLANEEMEKGPFDFEGRIIKKDKTICWIKSTGKIYSINNGEQSKIIGVVQDITERKQAEKSLEFKNLQLIRTNNDLDNFIYTASHDLKAPMSNIEGLLNSLRDSLLSVEGNRNEDTDILFQLMKSSINRFKTTILDLTEITKIQKEAEEDINEINLSQLVEDVKLSISDMITESRATIKTDFSNLNTLKFSKKNLRSIVYNLLSNAVKYRDKNRESDIFIKTETNEGFNILIIQDNGLGIKKQGQEKLFTMFKRFHDHVEGTGIGLYIVKRIMDNSGGKIEVESEEGIGTTFKIYFKA